MLQRTTTLSTLPNALAADSRGHLYLAMPDVGLLCWDGITLSSLLPGPAYAVAITLADQLYVTLGEAVYMLDLNAARAPLDLTAHFGGAPSGARRLCCAHDGAVWVEGCPHRQLPDGTYAPVPHTPLTSGHPIPLAHDQHGNDWSLVEKAGVQSLLILAADQPDAWQVVPLPAASSTGWLGIIADESGFLWLAGAAGVYQLNPRRKDHGWVRVATEQLSPPSILVALAVSPQGKALLGFATGQLYEAELNAAGETQLTPWGTLAPLGAARLYIDARGAVWAATEADLLRQDPAPDAWQRDWTAMGRLPCGNHDIFAAAVGEQLFISGGLTSGRGFPAVSHVFDELYGWDSPTQPWRVASHMPFPRCYNGIAYFAEKLWMVGGSANLRDPGNPDGPRDPLASVVIYDPKSGQWIDGPTLQTERIEPVVLAAHGRLYAMGGANAEKVTLATVESIGADENAWRAATPLPVAMRQFAGCELEGRLYVCGQAGFFAYDPVTARWDTTLPAPPTLPQAALMTAHRGEVWVLGGNRRKESWRFSPQRQQWQRGPDLPTEQSWAAAASHQGRLLIIGGAHWSTTHQLYVFDDRTYFYNAA